MMLRLLFHKFSKINTGDIKSILRYKTHRISSQAERNSNRIIRLV